MRSPRISDEHNVSEAELQEPVPGCRVGTLSAGLRGSHEDQNGAPLVFRGFQLYVGALIVLDPGHAAKERNTLR